MRNRWKVLVMCFMFIAAVLLEPVSYVYADEEVTEEEDVVPFLDLSLVEFQKDEVFDLFGLLELPEESDIDVLYIAHLDSGIDYSIYELVCDFELKTMREDESVSTSSYSLVIDYGTYYNQNIFEIFKPDIFDKLSTSPVINKWDINNKNFSHSFDYDFIVNQAAGVEKRKFAMTHTTYNTVISRVEFSFRRKSDGKVSWHNIIDFTWDSDFWLQKCVGIEHSLFSVDSGESELVDSQMSETGVVGLGYEEEFIFDTISTFIKDIPRVLVALVVGFGRIVIQISELFQAVFPFLPPLLFYVFGVVIFLTILVAVYKIITSIL